MSEDLPFGSRGGISVNHYFPVDGEYKFKVLLQRGALNNDVLGVKEPHVIDIRLDGAKIRELKSELEQHESALPQLYEHWEEAAELNG